MSGCSWDAERRDQVASVPLDNGWVIKAAPRSCYLDDLARHDLTNRIVTVHEAQFAQGGAERPLKDAALFWRYIAIGEQPHDGHVELPCVEAGAQWSQSPTIATGRGGDGTQSVPGKFGSQLGEIAKKLILSLKAIGDLSPVCCARCKPRPRIYRRSGAASLPPAQELGGIGRPEAAIYAGWKILCSHRSPASTESEANTGGP